MSLRYALLALLIDGEATGYELSKRFDRSAANFWHALPQQLYAELSAMERDGLVEGEMVVQKTRPNKRVFSMTAEGRQTLSDWFEAPARMPSIKDELLIRMYAADLGRSDRLVALLEERLAQREDKLAFYESLRAAILRGRSEDEFVRTTRRLGPYLALKSGIVYEQSSLEWTRWAIAALRARGDRRDARPMAAASPPGESSA
jgi:DNA-binding PadR family transcriptional regulator